MKFTFEQRIEQLEKRKGGYFYLKIDAEIINQFEKKRHTRLVCTIDNELSYSCGLNHLGDGNYFIIVASKHLKNLGKGLGDSVTFNIIEDPNPLGVEMPEVLKVLLEQDEALNTQFEKLSMGKKRSIIYTIIKIKDIDAQIAKAIEIINTHSLGNRKR